MVFLLPRTAAADVLVVSDTTGTLSSTKRAHWLNAARCSCGTELTASIDTTGLDKGGRAALVAGKSCLTSEDRISDACRSLWGEKVGSGDPVRKISVSAEEIAGDCSAAETTLSLYLLYDATDEDRWTSLAKLELGADTRAPAAPKSVKLVAGEALVEVAFEAGKGSDSGSDEDEALRYQVLCTKASGAPAVSTAPDAAFDAAADRCGDGEDTIVQAKYVCAEAQTGTGSITVTGLTNGETYTISVVAVDAAGNPSAPAEGGEVTPAPEEDFWERYQRSGGQADGAGCTTAGSPGAGGVLLLLGLSIATRRIRA